VFGEADELMSRKERQQQQRHGDRRVTMAGSISATTATLIAAGVAAGSTGYSIYAGQKQQGAQKKALCTDHGAAAGRGERALDGT
jgi:hypothetical protein